MQPLSVSGRPDTFSTAHTSPPGRDGLLGLIKSLPSTAKYEPGVILAERDYVIAHGSYSGLGFPASWIVTDIIRMVDGVFIEHWDVILDEATKQQSKSGHPMFGDSFPT